jgi:MOSC domain-containing protein YiiM
MSGRIFSLNTGKAHTILQNGRERLTAIGKQPVLLPLQMGELGLDGDVQVDKPDHGGVMKAVCCYPREHYEYWERRLGRRLPAAAFGENFTTDGQMEETVWIGDVFRVGEEAVVEVVQPRGPCATLAAYLEEKQLTVWVLETGFTGWYLRVLEPGRVAAGDGLTLVERRGSGVSVMDVNRAIWRRGSDAELTERVLAEELLAGDWQEQLRRYVAMGAVAR